MSSFSLYHATKTWRQAESILDNGFYPSDHDSTMLGRGIYVSSTIQKTYGYGPITFKLLVYPGRIITIDHQGHPRQKTWQSDFGSAWTLMNTLGMVRYQVCHINVDFLSICMITHLIFIHPRKIVYNLTIKYGSWESAEDMICFHLTFRIRHAEQSK